MECTPIIEYVQSVPRFFGWNQAVRKSRQPSYYPMPAKSHLRELGGLDK